MLMLPVASGAGSGTPYDVVLFPPIWIRKYLPAGIVLLGSEVTVQFVPAAAAYWIDQPFRLTGTWLRL